MTGPTVSTPEPLLEPAARGLPRVGGWRWRRTPIAAAGLAAAAEGLHAASGTLPGQIEVGLAIVVMLWLPGVALLRALQPRLNLPAVGVPGLAPVAGLVLWAPFAATGFAVGTSLGAIAAGVLAATALLAASPASTGRLERADAVALTSLAAAAAALGARWQAPLTGDALFHAGVVRKLVALPSLSLRTIWPFRDGHPHAGYAFPLLHVTQAGADWIAAIDPASAYRNLTPVFAAMVPLAAYPVGRVLAGRRGGWITGLLAIWFGLSTGGLISYSQQPRFTVTTIVLPGLVLLLALRPHRPEAVAAVAATAAAIAVLHVTYALPVVVIVAVVALAERRLALLVWPLAACAAVAGWIWWVALRGPHEHQYLVAPANQFLSVGGVHLALSGSQVFDDRPEFALAAGAVAWLLWTGTDGRRRLAVAAAAALLVATLPGPTLLVQAIAGPGQAGRSWETIPAVLVLGLLLATLPSLDRRRLALIAAASVAVSASEVVRTGAASAVSVGCALVVAALLVSGRRRQTGGPSRRPSAASAALAALAVMIGPLAITGPAVAREIWQGKHQSTRSDVTPGLVAYLQAHDRDWPVLLAPYSSGAADNFAGTAYALMAYVDAYTVAESSAHTESELHDQPILRREQVTAFYAPTTSTSERNRILRRWQVAYVIAPAGPGSGPLLAGLAGDPVLRRVYTDPPAATPGGLRFTVYRVAG
jgi:hypothetical protein